MKLYNHEHAAEDRHTMMLLLDKSDVFERLAERHGWKLANPLPRFLRVTFEHGVADVDTLVGSYLIHIGLAHMTPQRSTMIVWHTNPSAYIDSRRHVATMPADTVDKATALEKGWLLPSGQPRILRVDFKFGKAEVDSSLGEYLIREGIAQREPAFTGHSPEKQEWIDAMLAKRRTPSNDLWDAWH